MIMSFEEWCNMVGIHEDECADFNLFKDCWKAAQKELAGEVLKETKFWQKKVSAEKCLNDTIAKLGKEVDKS